MILLKVMLTTLLTSYILMSALWPVNDKEATKLWKGSHLAVWIGVMYWVWM